MASLKTKAGKNIMGKKEMTRGMKQTFCIELHA